MKNPDGTARARLEAIGFEEVGEWRAGAGCLHCDIARHPASKNVLYAFLCDGEVLYVGKTVSTLKSRMRGYERPAPSQTTNLRSHGRISELLKGGHVVKVLRAPDDADEAATISTQRRVGLVANALLIAVASFVAVILGSFGIAGYLQGQSAMILGAVVLTSIVLAGTWLLVAARRALRIGRVRHWTLHASGLALVLVPVALIAAMCAHVR